jgi:uncharacterized membrane protein YdbT with pleckstrin-like domain
MAYPTHLLTDDERVLDDFNPHWRALMAPIVVTVLAVVGAGLATWFASTQGWNITGWIWLVALLGAAGYAIPMVIQWKFTQYVLTTERIIVRGGVISKHGTEIPLEVINNVLFSQSAFERALGYGDVLVESAGSMGQSRLANIPDPEHFQSEIYRARERRAMDLEGRTDRSGGSAAPRDVAAQLESLSALHDAGKLTDEEFAAQKRRLLAE